MCVSVCAVSMCCSAPRAWPPHTHRARERLRLELQLLELGEGRDGGRDGARQVALRVLAQVEL